MAEAAAPTGKKSYALWIIFGVSLLIVVVLGIIYYYNKDFLTMAPKQDDKKKTGAPSSASYGGSLTPLVG